MNSISVIYLKKNTVLDISSTEKMQSVSKVITKIIINKIKSLYVIVYLIISNLEHNEQTFEEELYEVISKNVEKYVYHNVYAYITENNEINIDGFIIFRLKSLWDIIYSTITEYIQLKKENAMLVDVLNDILEDSDCISDKVTIIADDDNYCVYDDNMNILVCIKKYDDTLLDIILNISPNKICIYNKDKFTSSTLLNNIISVFKDRVFFAPE